MADRYLLESGSPDGYLLEDGSGVLLLEVPPDPPTGPIIFANGNQGVAQLGAAIGCAMLWGSVALFAPPQPTPQVDSIQSGTQRAHAAAQWPGRIFGMTQLPAAPPAPPMRPNVYGEPQIDPTQPRAVVFGTMPPSAAPIPLVPLRALAAAPQADPTQPAPVIQRMAPAPLLPPPLRGLTQASQQFDPTQPAARIFGVQPSQRPGLTGTMVARPQDDPTQIQPALYRAPPPSVANAQPPPLRGIIFAIGQSPEFVTGANWAQPALWAPPQPTPSPASISSMRDTRAFEGRAQFFGQYISPPPPPPALMPGSTDLGPLLQQGPESQAPFTWVSNNFPFAAPPQASPITAFITAAPQDQRQIAPVVFGQAPLTDTPYQRTVVAAAQVDPTQVQPHVFGTLPLPPVPLGPIRQAIEQINTFQPAPVLFAAPPPAAAVAPAPPPRIVVGAPQMDPTQPGAIVFRQQPLTDTPYSRTVFASPQADPTQPRAVVFGTQPPSVFPPPLRGLLQPARQDDPTQIQPALLKPAVFMPSIDPCQALLLAAYERIEELEAELAEALKHQGTGNGGASGDGDDIHHGHRYRDDNHAREQEAILERQREAKRRRIEADNAFILGAAAALARRRRKKGGGDDV